MKLLLFYCFFGFSASKKMITFETAEISYLNPEYGIGTIFANKYNATTFLINAEFNITKDMPTDAVVEINIFKLSDNTYKKTALSMKKKVCQFMEGPELKMMWSAYLEEKINIPKKCPLKAGHYKAEDVDPNILTANDFLNFLPQWGIKIEVGISSKNEKLLDLILRFKVIESY